TAFISAFSAKFGLRVIWLSAVRYDPASEVLDNDHFSLEKVKERIVEYLAVQQRANKLTGPILCLVGPAGVGKTSLGKSIARATGRNFVRFSLGGVPTREVAMAAFAEGGGREGSRPAISEAAWFATDQNTRCRPKSPRGAVCHHKILDFVHLTRLVSYRDISDGA